MMVGIHGAGIAIERVLNPTIAPARRFHSVMDTVFTIALGSVCAFALTLGPAPLNTVAASSAASASFGGFDQAEVAGSLLPSEVRTDSGTANQREAAEQRASERSAAAPQTATPVADAEDRSPSAPAPTVAAPAVPAPAVPVPVPAVPGSLPGTVVSNQAAAALAIVETYRVASGLAPFIDSEDCATPTLQATVHVTPPSVLPEGLAKKSLVPDPAHASAQDTGNGPVSVTVYSC